MSIQSARENAVLDVLARSQRTLGEVMAALDGHGMPASPRAVSDLLAALAGRGLVSRSGTAYRITAAGQAVVRARRARQPSTGQAAPWALTGFDR